MVESWLTGLLDDDSFSGGGRFEAPVSLSWPGSPLDPLIGSLVLPDDRLVAVDRGLTGQGSVPCRVINTGGAGGLVALARRRFDRLRLTGVRTGLRDLDDLGGAAARVAVAARELDPELTVLIELPDVPGWQRAVEAAELEGLAAAVADTADPTTTIDQLSSLIEADVPFVITGPVSTVDRGLELIMTVLALIDDVPVEQIPPGPPTAEQGARIRRRLLGLEVESVSELITGLTARNWLDGLRASS